MSGQRVGAFPELGRGLQASGRLLLGGLVLLRCGYGVHLRRERRLQERSCEFCDKRKFYTTYHRLEGFVSSLHSVYIHKSSVIAFIVSK